MGDEAAILVGPAKAQVAVVQAATDQAQDQIDRLDLSIVGFSRFAVVAQPTAPSGIEAIRVRQMIHCPNGAIHPRIVLSGAMATAAEQDFTTALVGKFSACATEPLPWEAGKQYQIGDAVIYFPVAGASGGFANNPYFVATTANINSPPRWDNPNWSAGSRPQASPVTWDGNRTSTIPLLGQIDGTSIAKGYIISDPIPVIVPVGGYLTLYEWGRDAGGNISYPCPLTVPPCHLAGSAVRGTAASNTDITDTTLIPSGQASGNTINNYWRQPALVLGKPVRKGPSAVIIGHSIANGAQGNAGAIALTITSGGSGFVAGDIVTISNTGASAGAVPAGCVPRFIVDTVGAGGAIATTRCIEPGGYTNTATQTGSTMPSGTQTIVPITGSGTGATATVAFGGNAGNYGDQRGAQGFVQRALSAAGVPFVAMTVNGDRYNLWKQGYGGTSRAHVRWSLIALAWPRNAVIEMAINDITAGDSLAVIQANAIDMIQRLRGLGVEHISMCTCSPATNSSTAAGQSTLAGQIVDATVNAKAQGYNAWVRGLCGGLVDSCWDDAAAVEEGGTTAPTGKWLPIGGKAAAADGKHPGPSATLLMAAAGASVIGQFK